MSDFKVKIDIISDIHMAKPELVGGDILLCAGDLSYRGNIPEIKEMLGWLSEQDYPHIIFIAGNHDFLFENEPLMAKELLKEFPRLVYLEDSAVEVKGLKIWGSPYTPWFHNWAFNLFEPELAKQWQQIPDDTDIVMTHGPPHGILDHTLGSYSRPGERTGCPYLKKRIEEIKPKYHIFGHIHEEYGKATIGPTQYINASIMDLGYKPVNKPVTIYL